MKTNILNSRKMTKKLLILVFVVIVPLTSIAQFSGGSGKENDPYIITTAVELAQLATYVNEGTTPYANANVHYKLNNNIDLSDYQTDKGWTPIGRYPYPNDYSFKGVFDGNGKKITKLTINDSTFRYVGLFGRTYNATVKNLGIEDVNIVASSPRFSTSRNTGGVVGQNVESSISNCYVIGTISSSATSVTNAYCPSFAGGIVGQNVESSISNCYSEGSVYSHTSAFYTPIPPFSYAGGIVGYNLDGSVSNCYSTSSVTASSGRASGAVAGGIVGGNHGNVSYCYATGSVSSSSLALSTVRSRAGGVVGYNSSGSASVSNCAALNPNIRLNCLGNTDNSCGRVAGNNNGTLTNNIAFSEMLNPDNGITWNNKGATQIDGEDISKQAINADGSLGGLFTNSVWTTANSKLPGLFGQTVNMPAHLSLDVEITNIILSQIAIYPNPTTNSFFIECENITAIKLYDMLGREVLTQAANTNTEVNISHLPKGVYGIRILSGDKVIGNKKIVKY